MKREEIKLRSIKKKAGLSEKVLMKRGGNKTEKKRKEKEYNDNERDGKGNAGFPR